VAKQAAKRSRAAARPKARPAKRVKAIPDGYRTVTPHLVLNDAAAALDFYKKALGAKETLRMPGPGGKVVHAEFTIGSDVIMVSDEMPPMPGQPGVYKSPKAAGLSTGAIFLYVPDVDAAFDRAIKAGCTVRTPLTNMFWGDRYGQLIDPFGHTWAMATHVEDVSPKEMAKRQQAEAARLRAHEGGATPSQKLKVKVRS
jgi:PhnB protein